MYCEYKSLAKLNMCRFTRYHKICNISKIVIFMKINITGIHLRNKFHFSEVHGSMNAMGHVQSK